MAIIGIDLGTTNSLMSIYRNGHCELIPNALGDILTPSVVSIDSNNIVYVGSVARERLVSHPSETAAAFKRCMGTNKIYTLNNHSYTPEELSSFVLKKLKEDASQYLNEEIDEAVISVPAYFNDAQRAATKRAGELAGLRVERIINEPSAAALACQHLYPEEETTELVFDFGGGTLDVSIIDCFDNVINVISISGDNHLGGRDFDLVIAKYFCEQNELIFEDQTPKMQATILKSAEICKTSLTEREEASMIVTLDGIQTSIQLSREKLIHISSNLFKRILVPINKAIINAELSLSDIDRIILVGGSCKMPVVELYIRHFLKKDVVYQGSPDTIVALGVGTYTGIKQRAKDVKDMLLTDVCPFTLGVNIVNRAYIGGDLMSPIIERNSTLPVSKAHIYVTASDNQNKIDFSIYQGEDHYVKNNLKLGDLSFPVPIGPMGKEKVEIRFTYNINGILEVDGLVLSTGMRQNLVILNHENGMSDEEISKALEEMKKLKIYPQDKEENQFLLSRFESLYIQAGPEQRDILDRESQWFTYLLQTQEDYKIVKGQKRFKKVMDMLEEQMQTLGVNIVHTDFEASWYQTAKEEFSEDEEEYHDWLKEGYITH